MQNRKMVHDPTRGQPKHEMRYNRHKWVNRRKQETAPDSATGYVSALVPLTISQASTSFTTKREFYDDQHS